MIERKRLSHQTTLTQRFSIRYTKPKTLLLSAILTFASMALSDAGLRPLDLTVATLIAAVLLTGSFIVAERGGHPNASSGVLNTTTNVRFLSLILLAWSVFLLLAFVNWQAAAAAALSLPAVAAMVLLGGQQASNGRLFLGSSLMAWPAFVGGAAATSSIDAPALFLFAIMFFWFGIDARLRLLRDELEGSNGAASLWTAERALANRIRFLALQLVIISMLPLLSPRISVAGSFGFAYPVVAIVMGIMVIYHSSKVARDMDDVHLRRTGEVLTIYPFLLILALIVDHMLQ